MIDWAQAQKQRVLFGCIGAGLSLAGLIEILFGVLKFLYELKDDPNPFSRMFAVPAWGIIRSIWEFPGVSFLWQHAPPIPNFTNPVDASNLYPLFLWFCLFFLGIVLLKRAKHLSHTLASSRQRAQEDHFKHERLGYQPNATPQAHRIMQVTGGTFHGPVIGDVSGAHAKVSYTSYNDLPAIRALINDMLTHMEELPFTPFQRVQFKTKLDAVQKELTSQVPNHSFLRKALGELGHTLRHIAEAGTAHVLVGHWQEILHTLQR